MLTKYFAFSCFLVLIIAGFALGQKAVQASVKDMNIPVYVPTGNKPVFTDADRVDDKSRQTVIVPSRQYPTIQSALNVECKIKIRPGVYNENLQVFPHQCITSIRAEHPGTVIINGGRQGNTVSLWTEAEVVLENLILINNQQFGNYDTAAVQGWGGVGFKILNCKIFSRSVGLGTSYASYVSVMNTEFIGLADDAIGIATYLNNPLGQNVGVRLYDNLFVSLGKGIYHYELHDPNVQTLSRCQTGHGCTDSNQYSDVAILYQYENGNGN
jgi:hypothetical protein